MDSFNHTHHSVNVAYWPFDQSSLFSCFPACEAAVWISSLIKDASTPEASLSRSTSGCCRGGGGLKTEIPGATDCWSGVLRLVCLFVTLHAPRFIILDLNENDLGRESLACPDERRPLLLPSKRKDRRDEGGRVHRSGAFMGCQCAPQPHNC